MKSSLSLLFVLLGLFCHGQNLIPRPERADKREGEFLVAKQTEIYSPAFPDLFDYLNDHIERVCGYRLAAGGHRRSIQQISIEKHEGGLSEEGYLLDISPSRITIRANDRGGAFYALQTLFQLMPVSVYRPDAAQHAETFAIPCFHIEDAPRFAYRGVMLDVSRNFSDKAAVMRYIDWIARHKLNTLHWHLTDDNGWRVEIKKYPELTSRGAWRGPGEVLPPSYGSGNERYGGFYTQDEAREIVRYAADRFITVIPEIEMPGHAMAALAAYPSLGCLGEGYEVPSVWGVKEDVFCAGNDSTFRLLEDVLTEVIDLFPSEYIHIGGDECPKVRWKACPKCQKRIRDEKLKDEFELQSYFVQRMEKFLNGKGRKIIGWDEILEGGLSKTATVMSWRGSAGGIEAAKSGNHVIMAPNTHCYLDYYPTRDLENEPRGIGGFLPIEMVYALDPHEGLNAHEREYILGVQGNLWTEFIAELDHAEYMLLPRLAAIAEVGWSYDRKDYPDFYRRMASLRKQYDINGYDYGKHMFAADSAATAPAGR